ncbi:TrkA family potassium uptake protein [bacterium]|nr:TrkA family potassium uptake protein [bacterium]
MKSILIIGMGKFGTLLGSKLMELNNEVMIVDKEESVINELAPLYTNALIGNCMHEGVLKSIGVNNFDICFVTIGGDFQASLEVTSQLKELGAKRVISKAERDIQAKFLLRNGADEIVYPERDIALKLAIRCNASNIFDFIELSDKYALFEIAVPTKWVKKSLREIDIRNKYKVNVIAFKQSGVITPVTDPDYPLSAEDHLIIMGEQNDVFRINK